MLKYQLSMLRCVNICTQRDKWVGPGWTVLPRLTIPSGLFFFPAEILGRQDLKENENLSSEHAQFISKTLSRYFNFKYHVHISIHSIYRGLFFSGEAGMSCVTHIKKDCGTVIHNSDRSCKTILKWLASH